MTDPRAPRQPKFQLPPPPPPLQPPPPSSPVTSHSQVVQDSTGHAAERRTGGGMGDNEDDDENNNDDDYDDIPHTAVEFPELPSAPPSMNVQRLVAVSASRPLLENNTTSSTTEAISGTTAMSMRLPPPPPPSSSSRPNPPTLPIGLNPTTRTTATLTTESISSTSPLVTAFPRPPPPPPPPPPPSHAMHHPWNATTTTTTTTTNNNKNHSPLPPPPPPPPPPTIIQNHPEHEDEEHGGFEIQHSSPQRHEPGSTRSSTSTSSSTTTGALQPPPTRMAMGAPPTNHDPSNTTTFTTGGTAMTSTTTTTTTTTTTALPPEPVPHTQFAPSTPQILAKRQTHIPLLLIASEAAQLLAWKNQLRLVDILEGLLQSMLGAFRQTTAAAAAAATAATTTGKSLGTGGSRNPTTTPPIPPFRSATKFLHLTWEDVRVTFLDASTIGGGGGGGGTQIHHATATPLGDHEAAQLLQQEAALKPSDGNLEEELYLLEDQVDNLLQKNNNNSNNTTTTHHAPGKETDFYTQWEDRQRQWEQVQKDAYALTSPVSIPWLWRYRQALDVCTNAHDHELFHCPPLAVCVCSSQEPDGTILETLQALKSSLYYLPKPFQNGLFDPHALQYTGLVLHDNVDGPTTFEESHIIPPLQQAFGAQAAAVLRINSISYSVAQRLAQEETMDLWGGGGKKGNCLSINDRVAIRQYLGQLLVHNVLPSLERRVALLNAVVSERKKGVRNVLKSFWRTGKTKEEEVVDKMKGGVLYRYDTIENQTRLLADTLFQMTDYEGALATYRLIRDDFKQDKAHYHYASVQEMMALCMYLQDSYGRSREILTLIENSLLSYSRASDEERGSHAVPAGRVTTASVATRFATRLCLVLATTGGILCNGRNLEVADLLASASSNENALGAAVLLEQGSAHYFQAGMYRKYAFHMLMSGHMFRTAEQHHHAFRCFTSALYIYRDGQWDELHNHLRSALAAQLYTMGRMTTALQLYAKLVGCMEGGGYQ